MAVFKSLIIRNTKRTNTVSKLIKKKFRSINFSQNSYPISSNQPTKPFILESLINLKSMSILPPLMLFGWQVDNLYMNGLILFHLWRDRTQAICNFIAWQRNKFTFNVRNVNKHRIATSLWWDETVTFLAAELLYCALEKIFK